jgi:copper homeostasis protein
MQVSQNSNRESSSTLPTLALPADCRKLLPRMTNQTLIEVCVDSVESALAAQAGGADRIELCQDLSEGGLTPSAGLFATVRERVKLPIAVMIRPRGADFCYSEPEFEVMRSDLQFAKQAGANMMVLGLLTPDGSIDVARTGELIALARPLPVTFHRAFDMVCDAGTALEDLIRLEVERVLTSGLERTAAEGLDRIMTLMRLAQGRITIVPGGGISEHNLPKILATTGAREFHISASTAQESAMTFRNPRVTMGRGVVPPEYSITRASEARVRAFRQLAG